MKKFFTKNFYLITVIILFMGATLPANAQYTAKILGSDVWASAVAKDGSGNIYVVEAITENGFNDHAKVLKYTNGTGSPTTIYTGNAILTTNADGQLDDYAFGLAVTSNGDVYVSTTTDYTGTPEFDGQIVKLTNNSGTYSPSVFFTGTHDLAGVTSLTVDGSDNLYCLRYHASSTAGPSGSYEVVKFPASGGVPSTSGATVLYDKLYLGALSSGDNYSNITGLAVDGSGNVYVADAFDSSAPANDGGHVYKLTKSGSTYTPSTFLTGTRTTALATDAAGNVYAANGTSSSNAYSLVEYVGGSASSPTTLYSGLGNDGNFFPFGIAAISTTQIYIADGSEAAGIDGNLLQLFAPPTTQATGVVFSNAAATTATATWTIGNGTSRAVFIKQATTGNPTPVNSTAYAANPNFGSGAQIGGSGWYCIYNGTGTTVNITGLTTGQTYRVMAVEYNGTPGSSDENYLQTLGTNNPNNVVALAGETITFNALPTKTYGDADFSPGATSTNNAVTIAYASDNTAVATIVSGNIHIVGQGTAHITASQAGDASHTAATDVVQLLTVNRAALTITANNQTKAYGAGLPTLTVSYSGFVNSETTAVLTTFPTITTTGTTASHVAGSPYAITPSGAAAANYTISYVSGTLSVTAVPLTITANNQSKVYGDPIPTLTASYTGLVNGDVAGSLTTPPTLFTTATAASHVAGNPYLIIASGAVDADYTISYVAGLLTVTSAPLTISADNQAKTYGDGLPTLTASYTGLVNGDVAGSLSTPPTLTTTATAASHVAGNPFPITASGAVDNDYTISYVAGLLIVTTAPLTITADDKTMPFGGPFPTLTASYAGFVNGDSGASLSTAPSLSTAATIASAPGPYTITPSGAADADYSISYVAGTLTVTPSSDAALASLSTTAGTITPAFDPATLTGYMVSVPNATSSTTVTPTADGPGTTIQVQVNGGGYAAVSSGTASGSLALNTGNNQIDVQVTAQDGTTQSKYSLVVNRGPSSYAFLRILSYSPAVVKTQVSGPDYKDFTATVNNDVTSMTVLTEAVDANATVKVNGMSVSPDVSSPPITLNVGANVINTVITAEDGVTKKTYSLTVTRLASANALATSISYSPTIKQTLVSGPDYRDYTSTVPYRYSSVTVTPVLADPTATVTVNNVAVSPGTASAPIALSVGDNIVKTVVTAGDGVTTKTYSTTITRALSTNALLQILSYTPPILKTEVSGADFRDYVSTVSNSVSTFSVLAVPQDNTATVTVNGVTVASGVSSTPIALVVGTNTINTVVTAGDGVTQNTYSITITRLASTNALANISYSPTINKTAVSGADYRDYTATVPYKFTSITVTPVTDDNTATVTVNNVAVTPGTASAPISLNLGDNVINTVVTAGDGTTVKTYSLTITRAMSTDALLSTLSYSPSVNTITVSGADYRDYTATVANSVASIAVMPVTQDNTATVTVNNVAVESGNLSGTIALNVGANTINTVVTAQDGTTTNTYSIVITRLAPPSATSLYDEKLVAVAAPLRNPELVVHQNVSPNGDGRSDVLVIDGITTYPENTLQIMSRSGSLVYEAKGYDNTNKAFDGHANNGKLQQPGTYFYSLEYKDGNETKRKTGFIILKY